MAYSASTFTVLTIGDGLVSQIPALIIATATGIVATRTTQHEEIKLRQQTHYATHRQEQNLNHCGFYSLALCQRARVAHLFARFCGEFVFIHRMAHLKGGQGQFIF